MCSPWTRWGVEVVLKARFPCTGCSHDSLCICSEILWQIKLEMGTEGVYTHLPGTVCFIVVHLDACNNALGGFGSCITPPQAFLHPSAALNHMPGTCKCVINVTYRINIMIGCGTGNHLVALSGFVGKVTG
jgi:hypothetical protein